MSVERLIWLCVAVLGVILAGGILTELHFPSNMAFAFSTFGASLVGMFAFAFRTAVEDKRHHHD
jgi:hypothetical protein